MISQELLGDMLDVNSSVSNRGVGRSEAMLRLAQDLIVAGRQVMIVSANDHITKDLQFRFTELYPDISTLERSKRPVFKNVKALGPVGLKALPPSVVVLYDHHLIDLLLRDFYQVRNKLFQIKELVNESI